MILTTEKRKFSKQLISLLDGTQVLLMEITNQLNSYQLTVIILINKLITNGALPDQTIIWLDELKFVNN